MDRAELHKSFSERIFERFRLRATTQQIAPGQTLVIDLQQAFNWKIFNNSGAIANITFGDQPVSVPIPSGLVETFDGDIRTGFDDQISVTLDAGAIRPVVVVLFHLRPAQDEQPIVQI